MKKSLILTSMLLFLVCSASPLMALTASVKIRSEAHIKDILELTVSQAGQSELRFGAITASATPAEVGPIKIVLEVFSNTGVRYQVTQLINGAMQNSNGDQITPDHINFKSSAVKSTGTAVSTPTPLSSSMQTIFISDNLGTSDTISAEYRLTPPPFQAPGDYSALLTYTASAL